MHRSFAVRATGLVLTTLTAALTCAGQCPDPTLRRLEPAPLYDKQLTGPLRGLYGWLAEQTAPTSEPEQDFYQRYAWRTLEPSADRYDFSPIDHELQHLPPGAKFGFRVMAMNPNSWVGGTDVPQYVADKLDKGFYVPAAPGNFRKLARIYIPDWNDPFFLERLERFITALGARYDGDPHIGWIEIGMYGAWGEWHRFGLSNFPAGAIPYYNPLYNASFAEDARSETKHRIIRAYANAFRRTQLLMMTDDADGLAYALSLSTPIPIGLRRDSWGSSHFADAFSSDVSALMTNRWKIAPFIVESFGGKRAFQVGAAGMVDQIKRYHVSAIANGGFAQHWDDLSREEQDAIVSSAEATGYRIRIAQVCLPSQVHAGETISLDSYWINEGAAPTYESWNVHFLLVSQSRSRPVVDAISNLDISRLLPGSTVSMVSDSLRVPQKLAPGKYVVEVSVTDRNGYRKPLPLAIQGRDASGAYGIASISVQ